MSSVDQSLPRPFDPALRLWTEARRMGLALIQREVAPLAMAGLGVALVVLWAGTAVVMSGLALLAAPVEARLTAQVAPPPQAMTELTLSPDALRDLDADQARAANAALPFSTLPILAARPFVMPVDRPEDYARALDCLTAAIYYEAASETTEGQAAVAQVVLNRSRHPAYPRTVCGVVFQGSERTTGCQFTFSCDGAMARTPNAAGWARARAVAAAALNGAVAPGVGMATHYHTDWVAPYWAPRLVKMKQIGTHIFYRWPGAWGLPSAFTGAHPGAEPVVAALAPLAEPVLEILTPAPVETVMAPLEIEVAAPRVVEVVAVVDAAPVEAAAPIVVARPAPPPVMASPMASPEAPARARRTRIAAPSSW